MVDFSKHLARNMVKKIYNDCETTSTDPRRGAIIQWTSIVLIEGKEVDHCDILIKPRPEDEIQDGALAANHITPMELIDSSRITPDDALKMILNMCGKYVDKYNKQDKFFWCGYRAQFDLDFTHEFFKKGGDDYCGSWFWSPALDIMCLAGFLFQKKRSSMKDFKLRTVWEALFPSRAQDYTDADWHDALFDIRRTIEVEEGLREVLRGDRKIV